MLPQPNPDGNLPAGIHQIDDWQEFLTNYAVTPYRKRLAAGLAEALKALRSAGCKRAYIDGSFITTKAVPADYDGCWDIDGVDPDKLDAILLTFDPGRAAQKAKYGGELFPASFAANSTGETFLDFFQKDKSTGQPKGIVAIDLTTIKL